MEQAQLKESVDKKDRLIERLQLDVTNTREEFNSTADEVRRDYEGHKLKVASILVIMLEIFNCFV